MSLPLNIGVSACLLGQAVRYDGAHKRHDLLTSAGAGEVRWIAVCPEVELGLGVPREKIQLERDGAVVRLVTLQSRRDLTDTMTRWAMTRLDELEGHALCGYVFKSRSPSCGLAVSGMFAGAFTARFPDVPVIEETGLADEAACRAFLERARAYRAKLAARALQTPG